MRSPPTQCHSEEKQKWKEKINQTQCSCHKRNTWLTHARGIPFANFYHFLPHKKYNTKKVSLHSAQCTVVHTSLTVFTGQRQYVRGNVRDIKFHLWNMHRIEWLLLSVILKIDWNCLMECLSATNSCDCYWCSLFGGQIYRITACACTVYLWPQTEN